jgi:hypothetical protein
LLLALSALSPSRPANAQPTEEEESFQFALIGDLGYNPAENSELYRLMDELNATPGLAFVVHNGDLWNAPLGGCTDENYDERLEMFQGSVHPFIFTPGDNDWTDCHRETFGGYNPLERLSKLRAMFFADEMSLGQRRLPLIRQSRNPSYALYRENAMWDMGGVTFLTVHIIGSNNNLLDPPDGNEDEYRARNEANLAWIRAGFSHARTTGSRGIMIIQQADPLFELPAERRTGMLDSLQLLEDETIAFGGPVVLVHGDTHRLRIDKPLRNRENDALIENFTRVMTFGTPDVHWLMVTVDPSDPSLFTVRQRLVESNLQDHTR